MKALICLNHYDRIDYLKEFAPEYIHFCNQSSDFDLVIGLDGSDSEIIKYCEGNNIPCVFSDKNCGVGIVKNRIFTLLNNYDYYFFIDDDVELLNPDVFIKHVKASIKLDIHHFSLGEKFRFFGNKFCQNIENIPLTCSDYGSGAFNFFTHKGLKTVGGFHDLFATYKRFGHTEHSHRFKRNNLAPAPFNFITNCLYDFIWHNPISNKPKVEIEPSLELAKVEKDLMLNQLSYYPFNIIGETIPLNIDRTPTVGECFQVKCNFKEGALQRKNLVWSFIFFQTKNFRKMYICLFKSFGIRIRFKKIRVVLFFSPILGKNFIKEKIEEVRW